MTYVVDEKCIKCKWLALNREYGQKWPNIAAKDMPKDAKAHWDETGKFEKYFSPKPGAGD